VNEMGYYGLQLASDSSLVTDMCIINADIELNCKSCHVVLRGL